MSVDDFSYDQFVLRNAGYIQPATQEKIRNTRLLIAGCGMGSSPAMCAARLGFEKFILVDGDTVDAHNLNRQFYEFADVGKPKVEALKGQILRINPQAEVEAVQAFLDAGNTEAIVGKADIVFDTIDFVDLPAILRLHGAARARGADVFTALNVGFGALVWYFPAGGPLGLSVILAPDLADANAAHGGAASYADVFARFILRIAPYLDKEVVDHVGHVLHSMSEGKACPDSQIAVGSFAVGAMALAMMHDALAGKPVPAAPRLVIHSFTNHATRIVDVSAPTP